MNEDAEIKRIKAKKLEELLKKSQKPKPAGVVTLTSSSFDKFLQTTRLPVLVDFWAGWCMPCTVMSPVIEELAHDYTEKAAFAKVNVDENPDIPQRYNIMGIPHFLIFKNGKPVDRVVGAVGRGPLEAALKNHLKPE